MLNHIKQFIVREFSEYLYCCQMRGFWQSLGTALGFIVVATMIYLICWYIKRKIGGK